MNEEKRFLVDVGMSGLPFPIKVSSKADQNGQSTVADITINARIMHEFEAQWIDKFIKIVHDHRGKIGTATLKTNILDYLRELNASMVKIDFEYPFFIEKETPVSKEKCLVRYFCRYSAKANSIDALPKIVFRISIPVITTYPVFDKVSNGNLFAQTSIVDIEIESKKEMYPEELVELVDNHALMPIYSFLTPDDQNFVIRKIHSEKKTSIVMIDDIKNDLAHNNDIQWYQLRCSNYGILHSYHTVVSTEKSMWVPLSGYDDQI
jgi:GTP cyclohydrolase IB